LGYESVDRSTFSIEMYFGQRFHTPMKLQKNALKMYFGQRFHTPMKLQKNAFKIENVLRSTLSYPNATSKECIQFL
jgi:hypothetical protein